MVEVLQFIFGGTALWGIARFIGVLILLTLVMCCLMAGVDRLKKK